MGLPFTQVNPDDYSNIQFNSGVIFIGEFDLETGGYERANILGITTGNISFESGATFVDLASDMNNVPEKTKQFKRFNGFSPKLSGTFVTMNPELCAMLTAAAKIDPNNPAHIIPRTTLEFSDFVDIWFVSDYSSVAGGFVAIKMTDVLNTEGFKLQTQKDGKGTFSFTFEAHYSTVDIDKVPFEMYIKKGSSAA